MGADGFWRDMGEGDSVRRGDDVPHEHAFVFLRQEKTIDPPRPEVHNDVFFCSVCLEYKRVEVWRGRYGF